jgi:hypothetical protein
MAIRKSSRTVASGGYHSASEADPSEQGWLEFLAAENVTDWVVLHGGAIAVFRVQPTVEAARLTEAVAAVRAPQGSNVLRAAIWIFGWDPPGLCLRRCRPGWAGAEWEQYLGPYLA